MLIFTWFPNAWQPKICIFLWFLHLVVWEHGPRGMDTKSVRDKTLHFYNQICEFPLHLVVWEYGPRGMDAKSVRDKTLHFYNQICEFPLICWSEKMAKEAGTPKVSATKPCIFTVKSESFPFSAGLTESMAQLCIFMWFPKAWLQKICIFTWFPKAWQRKMCICTWFPKAWESKIYICMWFPKAWLQKILSFTQYVGDKSMHFYYV